jgi:SAM-dependent methyltransferase
MVDHDAAGRSAIAGVYSRAAPTYDMFASSYFAHFAARLVRRAGVAAGSQVLDAACGTGAVALASASILESGSVLAVDLAEGMVAAARSEFARRGHRNAAAAVMDLESLGLRSDRFDTVLCAFALHIVPNPLNAVSELAWVTKPGGVFACSVWGEDDHRWDWEDELLQDFGATGRLKATNLAEADVLRNLLEAGWKRVDLDEEEYIAVLRDEEEWWAWKWSYGIRVALEGLDPSTLARLKDTAFDRMQPQRVDGLSCPASGLAGHRDVIVAVRSHRLYPPDDITLHPERLTRVADRNERLRESAISGRIDLATETSRPVARSIHCGVGGFVCVETHPSCWIIGSLHIRAVVRLLYLCLDQLTAEGNIGRRVAGFHTAVPNEACRLSLGEPAVSVKVVGVLVPTLCRHNHHLTTDRVSPRIARKEQNDGTSGSGCRVNLSARIGDMALGAIPRSSASSDTDGRCSVCAFGGPYAPIPGQPCSRPGARSWAHAGTEERRGG